MVSVLTPPGEGLAPLKGSPLSSVVGGVTCERKTSPSVEITPVVGEDDKSREYPASRSEAVGIESSSPRRGTVVRKWVNGWVGDGVVPSGSIFVEVGPEPCSAVAFAKCAQMAINVQIRKDP